MATLDWHVTTGDDVTLVCLLVTATRAERVRVENCLDGPVWPPRRQGVPEEGWDENGFEGVVDAGDRLVLGYASPAVPADPPARISAAEPADEDRGSETPSAREVVRTLGDPRPPRDAVPAGGRDDDGPATTGDRRPAQGTPGETGGRDEVEAWLDRVRERLEAAERLARVSSVREAREAVTSVGGAEDVAALRTRLDADRERLAALAADSESLATRIDRVEVPVETLERLA